jgi:lysozyme family protein
MPAKTNKALESEYRFLFDTCIINSKKFAEIDSVVSTMVMNKSRYDNLSNQLNIPWNFIAIIHCLEGSLSFSKHLHNGDPLKARTVHVPAGRPANGVPPFTWEQSATDALTIHGFTKVSDWSIPAMLFSFESYNGMGYRKRGVNSPYLWSFSNHYTGGKFTADGFFDPNAVSRQIGAAVLLRRMSEMQIAVKGEVDTITLIKRLGEDLVFDPNNFHENAAELQRMLNSVGQHLRVDGKAGKNTSDAYHSISGKLLKGDKR